MNIVADYLKFVAVKGKKYTAAQAAIMAAVKTAGTFVFVVTAAVTLGPAFTVTTVNEKEKPENVPTFASHQAQARQVCDGPVVRSGHNVYAWNVVVVKNDGHTYRMDTTEAIARAKSPEKNDDVWVVGICKKDLVQ